MTHLSRQQPIRRPSPSRRVWRTLAGTLRFVGRLLRGLIAAAVLLALVAGLPWASWHYIGWPLPDHIPTWAEVQGVLLGPMTTTFLIDVLACLCWITWAAFTFDVLRCAADVALNGVDAVRSLDFSSAGPRALAGVLIGAIVMSVLGNRPAAPVTSPATLFGNGTQVVATAPTWQNTAPAEGTVRTLAFATPSVSGDSDTVSTPPHPESVVVLAPQNGVHDSLWRIAARTLGDGARWPEIFNLNKDKPQPGGRTLTQPSLIFPGQELFLPSDATAPTSPTPANPTATAPTAPAPTTAPTSSHAQPSNPRSPAPSTDTEPSPMREPGFSWGPELFVGLGLAAAISAALTVARRHYNSRYRPGSGDRSQLPVAPTVYQLRLAHLRTEHDDEIDPDEDDTGRPERVPPPPPLVIGEAETSCGAGLAPGLGVRDGREIALDLATARGLGLLGAGAPAAIRALLVSTLTGTTCHSAGAFRPGGTTVFVPAADLASVLGHRAAQAQLPAALCVVADVGKALDALEAEILVRAAADGDQDTSPETWPPLVLVTRPPEHRQRLQAILDNGAPFGITGLLLGQWQPGVTAYVREDGTVSATGPGIGEALRGTRMFRLGNDHTAELLTLLRQAETPVPQKSTARWSQIVPELPTAASDDAGLTTDHAHAEVASDTELEITAALPPPASPDTDLEILSSTHEPPPRPEREALHHPTATPGGPSTVTADERPTKTDEHSTSVAEPAEAQEATVAPVAVPITISIMGAPRMLWHPEPHAPTNAGPSERDITDVLQPKTMELLVLLGLHPDGITRDAVVSALWRNDMPARPTNALHTSLSRMHHAFAVATDGAVRKIVLTGSGRYRFDPAVVRVDYWRFASAVAARRAASTESARTNAYRAVINNYGGTLAEGMSAHWIDPAREATRRDAVDAVAALARAMVEDDPQQTLDLLEVARAFDPHNEAVYRDIMRLQERLGQSDAITRTLTLLTTRLAEIDETPSEHALALATRLRQRHHTALGARQQARG
jgi:DNA-binding SARP family transcriptional activator